MTQSAMSATSTPRRSGASQVLRTAAIVGLLCLGIALLLTALAAGRGFALHLLYSLSIGLCCWIFIEGGHRLLDRWRGSAAEAVDVAWPGWVRSTLLVALGTLAGYSLGAAIANAISGRSAPMPWQVDWRSSSASLVISFAAAAVATLFFMLQGRVQAERTRAEAAQRQAAEHQLRLLESQLEPHMLFNTLANLRVLIALDPPRAQAMLDRLIGYLRSTLAASRAERHTLADEFARLEDYLALMQVRMGDRLQVRLELPAALAAQPVPPLLLQPLVENAIQHGLEPCCGEASIRVRAEQLGDRLRLSVRDSGVGVAPGALEAPPRPGHGFGTRQVRERLATLYGARADFTLLPADGGGTEATVLLPFEPA
jgi:sensor histidine kinase YesM